MTIDAAIDALLAAEESLVGRTHLLCLPFASWSDRVGTYFDAARRNLAGRAEPGIERLILVAAPNLAGAEALALADTAMRAAADRMVQSCEAAGSPQCGTIELLAPADWSLDALVELIEGCPPRSLVAVVGAADYRDPGLVVAPEAARGGLLATNEIWSPHLLKLAQALADVAKARDLLLVLDSGRSRPTEAACRELAEIADFEMLSVAEAPEEEIERRMPQWRAWLAEGRLGPVIQEVDRITGIDDDQRSVLLAQIYEIAGFPERAVEQIRRLSATADLSVEVAAKFARMAATANARELARSLLRFDIGELVARQDFQNALEAATRAGLPDLAERIEQAFERLFPGSSTLARHRYDKALHVGDHRAAAAALDGQAQAAELREFHLKAADVFDVPVKPDYIDIIAEAGDDALAAARFRLAAAGDARRRGLIIDAFELLTHPDALSRADGSGALVAVIEQLLLKRVGNGFLVDEDRIADAIGALIARMAAHPGNKSLRGALIDLLDPKTAGEFGSVTLLNQLINLSSVAPPAVAALPAEPSVSLKEVMEDAVFRDAMRDWTVTETPLRVGRTVFPKEALPASADAICSALIHAINDGMHKASSDDYDNTLWMVGLAAAIAPHASVRDLDLKAIRIGAAQMAATGATQPARDLIEEMLERADTPVRQRVGWFAMADIYNRSHNHLVAALYACAGLGCDTEIDQQQLWFETQVVHRILRAMKMFPWALNVLNGARALLDKMGMSDDYGHQIDTMAIQTQFLALNLNDDANRVLRDLIAAAVVNAATILEKGDNPGPIALVLGQLVRIAHGHGVAIPEEAIEMRRQLADQLGGSIATLNDLLAKERPTADDLLTILGQTAPARYSDDVGKDAHPVALTAQRALDADDLLADPSETAFAIEMIADRSIAVPGWDGARVPTARPETIGEPGETARSLSADGVDVLIAGLARDGTLVRVTARAGELEDALREPTALFSAPSLRAWRRKYPIDYGMNEAYPNRFHDTTEALKLSFVPAGPTLVIADSNVSSFPPNLLRVDNRFAGELHPMAAAPSLSWLKAARMNPRPGDGRRKAWISSAEGQGTTLTMIADRLADPLEEHGFILDQGTRLPDDFAGASLAVVVAHGGLNREGSAFQVVSDEGHLSTSAGDLADALHNVEVVILFVCSGGRSDAHPDADATLGLAREILDHGASAVVGSPWPLDSIVPPRWLPAFLERWDAGDRLIDAVFGANQAILRHWPHDLAKGLAMTLLGVPHLRAEPTP